MPDVDVFLLAGGQSRRMGRDKALLRIGGRTFVEIIAEAARPLARRITVVGRHRALGGIASLDDRRPGFGPLAGIETALEHAITPRPLVVACDLPMVTAPFLELLVGISEAAPDSIVVPSDVDGRLGHLCAVYPVAILPLVSQLLDEGERRPGAMSARCAVRIVTIDEYGHLDGAENQLRNVNTPDDFERLG